LVKYEVCNVTTSDIFSYYCALKY